MWSFGGVVGDPCLPLQGLTLADPSRPPGLVLAADHGLTRRDVELARGVLVVVNLAEGAPCRGCGGLGRLRGRHLGPGASSCRLFFLLGHSPAGVEVQGALFLFLILLTGGGSLGVGVSARALSGVLSPGHRC